MTAARDDHPVAVGALARKRGEIFADMEKRLAAHRADLVHIDNALRLMNSPIARRHPGQEAAPAQYRLLHARRAVSAAELADIALADKQIEDAGVRATFIGRFLVRLDQMALRGHVERSKEGQAVRWRLAGPL